MAPSSQATPPAGSRVPPPGSACAPFPPTSTSKETNSWPPNPCLDSVLTGDAVERPEQHLPPFPAPLHRRSRSSICPDLRLQQLPASEPLSRPPASSRSPPPMSALFHPC
ncbi:mucin-7-like [Triticum aestivum]|uniref:mucin-7-like n=1 Tax=Triticum aestivum TaxID=4565 RepID=UPI001D016F88|nr:mucin-7-like [Triticum aestivum]